MFPQHYHIIWAVQPAPPPHTHMPTWVAGSPAPSDCAAPSPCIGGRSGTRGGKGSLDTPAEVAVHAVGRVAAEKGPTGWMLTPQPTGYQSDSPDASYKCLDKCLAVIKMFIKPGGSTNFSLNSHLYGNLNEKMFSVSSVLKA